VTEARNDVAVRKRFQGISALVKWRKEITAAALPPTALPAILRAHDPEKWAPVFRRDHAQNDTA
jgi:hypothetical protein